MKPTSSFLLVFYLLSLCARPVNLFIDKINNDAIHSTYGIKTHVVNEFTIPISLLPTSTEVKQNFADTFGIISSLTDLADKISSLKQHLYSTKTALVQLVRKWPKICINAP